MAQDQNEGLQALAKNDVMSVRMEGLILRVLIERGLLSVTEAQGLVQDVIANAPKGSSLSPAYSALLCELR